MLGAAASEGAALSTAHSRFYRHRYQRPPLISVKFSERSLQHQKIRSVVLHIAVKNSAKMNQMFVNGLVNIFQLVLIQRWQKRKFADLLEGCCPREVVACVLYVILGASGVVEKALQPFK